MPPAQPPENFEFRQIRPGDELAGFSMGDPQFQPLKTFLQQDAIDFQEKNIAKTYVLVGEGTRVVWGYITLVCSQVHIDDDDHRPDDCDGAQKYKDFPAIKIARLALDRRVRGNQLGQDLVAWTISTVRHEIMPLVGCRFLIVDAKRCSVDFYKKVGFEVLAETEVRNEPVMYIDMHKLVEEVARLEELDA